MRRRTLAIGALAAVLATTAMAGEKILRMPMSTSGPKTLDPVQGSTMYENRCCSAVYQTLLQYSYLERPLQLEPLLAAEMPAVSEDGRTWRFKLRDDVYFQDDPCFPGGKGRKFVASDIDYSWKRLADPEYRFKSWWLVEDTIVGFDDYKQAQKARVDAGQPFDYDAPVEGLRVIDDHTFEVELTRPVQQFMWKLAMFQMAIVPREAVEMYNAGDVDRFSGHPVGTGAFILASESDWQRGTSLVLHRNPNYWDDRYPSEWMPEDEELGLNGSAAQRLPLLDRIEITFFVEGQPMWLEFNAGNLDFTTVPEFGFEQAFDRRTGELKRAWARKGIRAVAVPLLDFIFRGFNMEDELLGGYSPEKKALRQAICLAIDLDEMNEAYYNKECIVYDGVIPPGLDGHPKDHGAERSYRGPDLERSRAKLAEAGYTVKGGKVTDLPTIDFYTSQGAISEKMVALLQRNLAEVGVTLNPRFVSFAELIEAINNKKAPMFSFAWGSDYPDAENNLALFYSPNVSPGSNHYNYARPEYDALYEQIQTMTPGPERTAIYEKMNAMLIEDSPFAGSLARTRRYLIQPWLKNFKPTEDFWNYLKYLDVDMDHERRPQ